jgi:DNA-binding NarL/FixJ family response regulator
MTDPRVASLLLADDHTLFRDGLRELISHWEEFKVVGEASNGQQALELCRQQLPDIVLMDVQMPVMNGVESAWLIRKELPSVRVVMLTASDEEKNLFEAIRNGAQGYILKDTPARRLRSQLKGVMEDDAPLSESIAAKILAEFNRQRGGEANVPFEPLAEHEIQILQLVAEGLTNDEIGNRLFLSEQTVKKQLSNVLQKLHLNNRVQAAVYAVRKGMTK